MIGRVGLRWLLRRWLGEWEDERGWMGGFGSEEGRCGREVLERWSVGGQILDGGIVVDVVLNSFNFRYKSKRKRAAFTDTHQVSYRRTVLETLREIKVRRTYLMKLGMPIAPSRKKQWASQESKLTIKVDCSRGEKQINRVDALHHQK